MSTKAPSSRKRPALRVRRAVPYHIGPCSYAVLEAEMARKRSALTEEVVVADWTATVRSCARKLTIETRMPERSALSIEGASICHTSYRRAQVCRLFTLLA
jgi:hypothetical protein